MPNKKSAMKALKQDKKKALRNFKVKKNVKDLVRDSKKLIESKDGGATEKVKAAIKSIDKAVQNKVLKKNTGARKKSRLMKRLNKVGK
jgi:small subunit ribosomal protein S20